MRKEDVESELTVLAFDFFYWFSRFEFALKENKFLKNDNVGAKAQPGWTNFVETWERAYSLSDNARALCDARPEQQIVAAKGELIWQSVNLGDCTSDLARVVRLLKTVRNNLFHGGKHGGAGWDDPIRTKLLLSESKSVLAELAKLAGIEADYSRYY